MVYFVQKHMRVVTRGIFILLVLSSIFMIGCQEKSIKPLTIMQNKVEIDDELKAFAKLFEEETGTPTVVKTIANFTRQLRADFNAGDAPDIFVIEGNASYDEWKDHISDISGESWIADTDHAFSVGGKVYGFPTAIEGWGLAYNKDLLDKAGIDPKTLTSYGAYKTAFEALDSMKSELDIDSVVSMAAGPKMRWVASTHNLNSYLSNGLARDDTSVIDNALKGVVDDTRFREYAQWVKLLFDYAEPNVLTVGDYDTQVNAFINQKAVFLHQGNWVEPNLSRGNVTFTRAFAPHGSMEKDTDGIFVSAPSWYVVNKNGNIEAAKAFFKYLAETPQGHDYIVNKIYAVPAFNSVTLKPKAPLSASILEYSTQGKTYAWNQFSLPGGFRDDQLGPIYEQLGKNEITLDKFIELVKKEFATLQ